MGWGRQVDDMFANSDSSTGGGGLSNAIKGAIGGSWGGPIGSIVGGLGGLLGGNMMRSGFDQMGDQIQKAMDQEKQYYDEGLGYYKPYYDQGTKAWGQYGDAINGMSNPTDFINKIMSQYQSSPYAKFQMQEGERAANNAAAASGQLGSGAEQMGLMRYAQDVTNADQNKWLQNVLGANSQYLSGLRDQFGTGFGAAQSMDQNRRGLADNITELLQNLGLAQASGGAAQGAGLGSLLGGIGGAFGL